MFSTPPTAVVDNASPRAPTAIQRVRAYSRLHTSSPFLGSPSTPASAPTTIALHSLNSIRRSLDFYYHDGKKN